MLLLTTHAARSSVAISRGFDIVNTVGKKQYERNTTSPLLITLKIESHLLCAQHSVLGDSDQGGVGELLHDGGKKKTSRLCQSPILLHFLTYTR